MTTLIQDNATVLFQGDSITDYGRKREEPEDLGVGFVMMAASWFSAMYPEKRVRFLNRGIGGNKVRDLQARWEKDCLELKPDWVSILVGINDCWCRYIANEIISLTEFEEGYRDLLNQVRSIGAGIILCEPFVLPVPEERNKYREDLDPKIQAVRKLAREYGAYLVPLDGIFARAMTSREPEFWALDGVHPTPAGNALIARAWLETMKVI